jgi:tetratricopeptide (TPR) repeat protein
MGALVALFLLLQTTDFSAEGLKALEARQYDSAIQLFAKAVEADPKDYAARFHLALAYSLVDKDAEATAEYQKVLELKPGLFQAQQNLGIVLLRQKRAGEAVPLLREAAGQKPKEYRPRFYLAEALLASGDPAGAEEQYKLALEIDPKAAAAEVGLARAMVWQDRLDDAAPHFRKAAELDAEFKDALLELAEIYEKEKRPTEAIALYEQFPENSAAQERLGELLLESRRYEEAIPRLESAVQKDPTSANLAALAAAYLFSNQRDKALPLLDKSVAAEGGNYDLRMMYGRALRDQKRYPEAARQFHESVKLKSDSREAWNELAGMLYLLESYPQALAALDRARQLGEDTPANHYFRAITLDKMKAYQPALESYQEFLARSQGKNPDEEFKARQRIRVIKKELGNR